MAIKTYTSKLPSFSTKVVLSNGSPFTVMFVNGLFATDNADVMSHVEQLSAFGRQIFIKPEAQVKVDADKAAKANADLDAIREKAADEAEAKAEALAEKKASQEAAAKANAEEQAKRIAEANIKKADSPGKALRAKKAAEKKDKVTA